MYYLKKTIYTKKNIISFVKREKFLVWGCILACILAIVFYFLLPPRDFNTDSFVEVEKGTTMSSFAQQMKDDGYIKSVFLFQTIAIALGGDGGLVAGDYSMERPQNAFALARRFVGGIYDLDRIRVRLYEGESVYTYATTLDELLPRFDKVQFLRLAEDKEGYLFPDTYTFFETADEQDVLIALQDNFEKRTEDIRKKAESSKRTFEEIVIMASILEKEANRNTYEMQVIAGILWKRLDRGMLLQVDAPFKYYIDKGSFDLSIADLRTDHAYNTYTRKGLTPTPIGNPGRRSMLAALDPVATEYFFYLHGRDGTVRYAVTHDEHVENKRRYLR